MSPVHSAVFAMLKLGQQNHAVQWLGGQKCALSHMKLATRERSERIPRERRVRGALGE